MTQPTGQEPLPQLIAKPLVKISHATVEGDRAAPKWSHVTERDDLVLVLDHVRVLAASQQYVERRVLKVACGPDLIAGLDLDERMRHPSMDLYRRYGSQISLDQLPLGFLVRGTNLKITYVMGDSQVRPASTAAVGSSDLDKQRRVLQVKFKSDADCQEMASAFRRLGLPVKTGIGGDRPGSRRLSTAGSWSATPPNSQPRNIWSSQGSSSSQTVHAPEPTFPVELPHLGSQSRLQLPLSNMRRTSAGISSSPPSIHGSSAFPLEFGDAFTRGVSLRGDIDSNKAAEFEHHSQAGMRPPGSSGGSSGQGRGYGYQFTGGAGELLERSPVAPLDTPQQLCAPPSRNFSESHFSRPPTAMHTSMSSSIAPTHARRGQDHHDPAVTYSSSFRSPFPFSGSREASHRPWTVHGDGGMAPPPLPDRLGLSHGISTKRIPPERSVSRRSTRLAAKRSSAGLEEDMDLSHRQHPNFQSTMPYQMPELPPPRELPFGTPKLAAPVPTVACDTAALTALAETAAAATFEPPPAPTIEPPAAPAPKGKGARSPKKAATKTKASTSPAKKRAPRKTKAQLQAEAQARAQAQAPAQAQPQPQPQAQASAAAHGSGPTPTPVSSQAPVHAPAPSIPAAVEAQIMRGKDQGISNAASNSSDSHATAVIEPPQTTTTVPRPTAIPDAPSKEAPADPVAAPSPSGPSYSDQRGDESNQVPTTPLPPPVSPLTPAALPPSLPSPFLSREEAESLFDQRFKETIGGYLAKVGPCLTDIEGCLRRIVEATNELTSPSSS